MTVAHLAGYRRPNSVGAQHVEGPISRNAPVGAAILRSRRSSRQLGGGLLGTAPTGRV